MNDTHATLRSRRTAKMLCPPETPLPVTGNLSKERIDNWIDVAGNAPFHKPAHKNHLSDIRAFEPWRCVKLTDGDCRALASELIANDMDAGKVLDMLSAADGLVLVTWLPNPSTRSLMEDEEFEASFDNMENIAAASAFTQSLLIAGEADGWRTYWSSGGMLRREEIFEKYGIPNTQILIGAVFFFPPEDQAESVETKPGSLANKRAPLADWSRWV